MVNHIVIVILRNVILNDFLYDLFMKFLGADTMSPLEGVGRILLMYMKAKSCVFRFWTSSWIC